MNRSITLELILLLALVGCGGTPFTAPDFTQVDGASAENVDGGTTDGGTADGAQVDATPDAAPSTPDAMPMTEDGGTDADAGVDAPTSMVDAGHVEHEAAPEAAPPVPCDGAGLSTHHNGAGQTWADCVPVGTHTSAQALEACGAWCAAETCAGSGCWTTSFCGVEYVTGQVGVTGPDVKMTGWSLAGTTVAINPVTQTSCVTLGSWD